MKKIISLSVALLFALMLPLAVAGEGTGASKDMSAAKSAAPYNGISYFGAEWESRAAGGEGAGGEAVSDAVPNNGITYFDLGSRTVTPRGEEQGKNPYNGITFFG